MKQNESLRKRVRAERTYDWFLHLYPLAHQYTFGDQMRHTFRDHYHDAVETEGEPSTRFWLAILGDESKSLLREHIASLREGNLPLKALKLTFLVGLSIIPIYVFLWTLPGASRGQDALFFASNLLFFILLAGFLRSLPPSDIGRSWVRIGLVAGGIMALLGTVSNTLYAVVPIPQEGYNLLQFNVVGVRSMSLLLLGGVVGVLGGYAGGKIRTGLAACLLAGIIGMLGYAISQGLLIGLLWNTLAHQLLQSHLQGDYLNALRAYNSHFGPPVTPWNLFLYGGRDYNDGTGLAAWLFASLFSESMFAVLGAVLGATVSYRMNNTRHQYVGFTFLSSRGWLLARFVSFAFLWLVLTLLTWIVFAALQNIGSDGPWLSLSLLTGDGFALWLLGVLGMLALVQRSVRSTPVLAEARTPSHGHLVEDGGHAIQPGE